MVRRSIGDVTHSDLRKHRLCDGLSLLPREAHVERTERDVLADRRHEELVVGILEDDSDGATNLIKGLLGNRQVPDAHFTLSGPQEPVQLQQKGRFPGAIGSDQGDRFTMGDSEADPVQGAGAIGIGIGEIACFDDVVTHTLSGLRARVEGAIRQWPAGGSRGE